jgi:hypothetical protein
VTRYDRFACLLVRLAMRLVERRCDQAKGRVFWWKVETFRPRRLRSGAVAPKASLFRFGFGAGDAAAGNLATIWLSREMTEQLRDNIIEGLDTQDAQYAIVEERR